MTYFLFKINFPLTWNDYKSCSLIMNTMNQSDVDWVESNFYNVGYASKEMLEKGNEIAFLNKHAIPFEIVVKSTAKILQL